MIGGTNNFGTNIFTTDFGTLVCLVFQHLMIGGTNFDPDSTSTHFKRKKQRSIFVGGNHNNVWFKQASILICATQVWSETANIGQYETSNREPKNDYFSTGIWC